MKHLLVTLALVLSVISASAISFSIIPELSGANKLTVDAYWGDYNHNTDVSYTEWADLWAIEAWDWADFIRVKIMPYGWDFQELAPSVGIVFLDWENRTFANTVFRGFNGVSIEEQDKGARLTWALFPDIAGVPDSGSTLGLLGLALCGFGLMRRKGVALP